MTSLSLLLSFLITAPALGAEPQAASDEAKAIYSKLVKLSTTSRSDLFDQWFYKVSRKTAMNCLEGELGKDPQSQAASLAAKGDYNSKEVLKFLKKKSAFEGVYRSYAPADLKQVCASIAIDGFRPACRGGRPMVSKPIFKKKHRYPSEYIVLSSGQTHVLAISLECTLSTEKSDPKTSARVPYQVFPITPEQITSIDSFALSKWAGVGEVLVLNAKQVDPKFKSPYPVNLVREKNVTSVMATSLSVRLKSPSQKFDWPIAVEP